MNVGEEIVRRCFGVAPTGEENTLRLCRSCYRDLKNKVENVFTKYVVEHIGYFVLQISCYIYGVKASFYLHSVNRDKLGTGEAEKTGVGCTCWFI